MQRVQKPCLPSAVPDPAAWHTVLQATTPLPTCPCLKQPKPAATNWGRKGRPDWAEALNTARGRRCEGKEEERLVAAGMSTEVPNQDHRDGQLLQNQA